MKDSDIRRVLVLAVFFVDIQGYVAIVIRYNCDFLFKNYSDVTIALECQRIDSYDINPIFTWKTAFFILV